MSDTLAIVLGSTNYVFSSAEAVPAYAKDQLGELQRLSGQPVHEGIVDTPWAISEFMGLGVARSTKFVREADNRLFSSENIMTHIQGVTCLGPKKQSTTVPSSDGALEFVGFAHAFGELFMFAKGTSTSKVGDEAILYWDGTNWADTTAKDDITDDGGGTMIVSSMIEHTGRAFASLVGTLRDTNANNSIAKIVRSAAGDRTDWTETNSNSLTTNGMGTDLPYGLVSDGDLMYCATWLAATNTLTIRESPTGNNGIAWNGFTSNPVIRTARAPVLGYAAVMYGDSSSSSVLDYWIGLAEGLYHIDISAETFTRVLPFMHPESAFTGTLIAVGVGLIYTDGPDLHVGRWDANGWDDVTVFSTEVFPALKRGDITSIAFIPGPVGGIVFAVGGGDSSHNAGKYLLRLNEAGPHDLYYNTAANRAIFGVGFSSEPSGTPRIHWAEANGTSNDSSAFHIDDITKDPRTVSSYSHAAQGKLVLPKNDRELGELSKTWRRVQGIGPNFSSNNTVTVSAINDGQVADTDGSFTQLDDTSGSNDVIDGTTTEVYFPATPSATGEEAVMQQLLLQFDGTSNSSAYMEELLIHYRVVMPVKNVRSFVIDLEKSANGTVLPKPAVMTNLKAIAGAATDVTVTWSNLSATIMEPHSAKGALNFSDHADMSGTVNASSDPKFAQLNLTEV